MKLSELDPRIDPPNQYGTQFLAFRCPKCRGHEISIDIWSAPHGEVEKLCGDEKYKCRVWSATQGPDRDWDTLSVSPSINRENLGDRCGGWHGHIISGEIR